MRGNEFLDKMDLIDLSYVEAADAAPKKKKNVWAKWGATAACLCLVAAGAFMTQDVWNAPDPPGIPVSAPDPAPDPLHDPIPDRFPDPDGTTQQGDDPTLRPEDPVNMPGIDISVTPPPEYNGPFSAIVPASEPPEPTMEPMPELTTEPVPEPTPAETHAPMHNGNGFVIAGPNNVTEFPNVTPMISGYGAASYRGDMAVNNGGSVFSDSLRAAMDAYGDSVKYRVLVELFHDGVMLSGGGEAAWQEARRLSALGYITALETVETFSVEPNENGEHTVLSASYYFTLHATYEQLKNFPASGELGYSIMLYDEYFGIPSAGPDNVIFHINGFAQIDG
ncbi:MAG: hypothetical protein Q4A39_04465 [Eubacteriales bacterium]|nr:hypothetical protein [Eubacteriales bacterium]